MSKKRDRSRDELVRFLLRLLNGYLKAQEDLNRMRGNRARMLAVFQDEVKVWESRINNFKSCITLQGLEFIDLYNAAMELRK